MWRLWALAPLTGLLVCGGSMNSLLAQDGDKPAEAAAVVAPVEAAVAAVEAVPAAAAAPETLAAIRDGRARDLRVRPDRAQPARDRGAGFDRRERTFEFIRRDENFHG